MILLVRMVHGFILQKMDTKGLSLESNEALKSIFQEYEIHVNTIEQQLEMCKKDHLGLQAEIAQLVEENRQLYQRLKTLSENALQSEEKTTSAIDSDLVENLKQQLVLSLEENKTLEGLWKSCLQEIDALKDKLHNCQSGKQLSLAESKLKDVQNDYTEAITILEARLAAAKKDNDQLTAKSQVLENQLMKVTDQMAIVAENSLVLNNSLKEATVSQQEWKSRYLSLESKYIELDHSYKKDQVKYARTYEYERVESQLKHKLETALRQRDELQAALERCHERLTEQLQNVATHRTCVEEAVHLVDEAGAREAQLTEKVKMMKTKLNTLLEEKGAQLVQETLNLRKNCDNQLIELQNQLHIVEQERDRKITEVNQWQKECKRLQAILNQDNETKKVPEKRESDRLYQELNITETECLQLHTDNEALRDLINQLQDRCRKHSRDKARLKDELARTEEQREIYRLELTVTAERAELLSSQLHQTSLQLTQLQSEQLLHQNNMTNLQAKVSVANTVELCKKLDESYNQMNDKWKKEMHSLTENFEAKLKLLKSQRKLKKGQKRNERNERIDTQGNTGISKENEY